jgi:hypothetical protein
MAIPTVTPNELAIPVGHASGNLLLPMLGLQET